MTTRSRKKKQTRIPRKQDEATRMNVFYRNMKKILALYDCPEVVNLLNVFTKKALYQMRNAPVRVLRGNCPSLDKEKFTKIEDLLKNLVHVQKVSLKAGGTPVSLYEFFTIGLSLILVQVSMNESGYENAEAVYKLLTTNLNLDEADEQARIAIASVALYTGTLFSSLTQDVIVIETQLPGEPRNGHYPGLEFHIHTHKTQVHYFDVDRHSRPAFPIGLSGPGGQVKWINLNRSLFENIPYDDQVELPVYIQNHTFQRMTERLDLLGKDFFYFFICIALRECKVIRYKNRHLIQLDILGSKAGYLVANLIKDKLLIKTFLFLPSDGTPEGEKLKELSGLSKVDMKYWAIDRLSTYFHSDLKDNSQMRQLFNHAGCESLFKIKPTSRDAISKHNRLADCLIGYMQTNDPKELSGVAG